MRQYFNADSDANELGVHRFLDGWIQGFPPADGPWPVEMVKLVHEFDPKFRLMWVVNVWETPNKGIAKTGNYMIARQVINPVMTDEWIKNPVLPSRSSPALRAPFLSATILDARTDGEMQRGKLPKFEPFTRRHVESMRAAMWIRDNSTPDEVDRKVNETLAEEERKADRAMHAEAIYRRQNDRVQNRQHHGACDRVYVSDTLKQLREAAGVPGEAA
jgi:hypothetical protein